MIRAIDSDMLRTHWMVSTAAAKAYYRQSDYYASTPGEWLGKGAELLGLKGVARVEDFDKLVDNVNPQTGEMLRPSAREGQRVGMDLTFNSPKPVGLARELGGTDNAGDARVETAHRDAVAFAMGFVEGDMRTRVRAGGADEDRVVGNMVSYRVTHRDTRISAEDQKPDMSLHDHVFVMNAVYDPVEDKWKAAQMGQIKHDAPYYEAIYHNRLAANLRQLGYGIQKKDKSFTINGVSEELVQKFSRRRAYIKAVAEKLGITSPEGMSKLGATTRLGKAKELADDLNAYWVSRLTGDEKQELQLLEGRPSYAGSQEQAVAFSLGHLFERKSVVEEKKVYELAMRHGIGFTTPEGVEAEAKRQGLLVKGDESTTREALEQEGRIIAFAREGRGTMRPLGSPYTKPEHTATLSAEQQAVCRHIWESPDAVVMIEGDAGTGKTQTMQRTIPGIDAPTVFLAPSASASRGTLREKGFANADTIARFLVDPKFREQARGGVIYIDEAPLASLADMDKVFAWAKVLDARVILQGDRKQHKSVQRGNLFEVLDRFAGLPIGRLTENWRQTNAKYKAAVDLIAKGDIAAGYDTLEKLGWVKGSHEELVKDYIAAIDAKKNPLIVCPSHKEGDELTSDVRTALKERGLVSKDEKTFERLVPVHWTEAEKGDRDSYDGTELLQFHRNSGAFRAGQTVSGELFKAGGEYRSSDHFSVFNRREIKIASGDSIRLTSNGWSIPDSKGAKHRLDNGAVYSVAKVDGDDIELSNGWKLSGSWGHIDHAYVDTSFKAQGKTVPVVLVAFGKDSLPAINAEAAYVAFSRAREKVGVYSDLTPDVLKAAMTRQDSRKSATELIGPPKRTIKVRAKAYEFMKRMRTTARQLRDKALHAMREVTMGRDYSYER